MIENLQFVLAKICRRLCDSCDTTIYGQDEHWVRANFDRLRGLDPDLVDADDILSRGYLNWVNDRVGYALTNGFYKFTALFENDPLEATQLYIGNYVVSVTNAGEYVFLLEKGTDYEFGTRPFICKSQQSVGGIKLFFIAGVGNGTVDEPNGSTGDHGIVIHYASSSSTLAHEIGHVCRLGDIYTAGVDDTELYGSVRESWAIEDWPNGTGSCFYEQDLRQVDLIDRLVMKWVYDPSRADIPLGAVYGIGKFGAGGSLATKGQMAVGRRQMLAFPPHTQ